MENYIAPLLLFIVFFVGFGLSQRGKQQSGGCGSCTGSGCQDKSECTNQDKPGHH